MNTYILLIQWSADDSCDPPRPARGQVARGGAGRPLALSQSLPPATAPGAPPQRRRRRHAEAAARTARVCTRTADNGVAAAAAEGAGPAPRGIRRARDSDRRQGVGVLPAEAEDLRCWHALPRRAGGRIRRGSVCAPAREEVRVADVAFLVAPPAPLCGLAVGDRETPLET